jgi:hypothetical protein
MSHRGFPYGAIRQAVNHSVNACRSGVKAANEHASALHADIRVERVAHAVAEQDPGQHGESQDQGRI